MFIVFLLVGATMYGSESEPRQSPALLKISSLAWSALPDGTGPFAVRPLALWNGHGRIFHAAPRLPRYFTVALLLCVPCPSSFPQFGLSWREGWIRVLFVSGDWSERPVLNVVCCYRGAGDSKRWISKPADCLVLFSMQCLCISSYACYRISCGCRFLIL